MTIWFLILLLCEAVPVMPETRCWDQRVGPFVTERGCAEARKIAVQARDVRHAMCVRET